MDNKKKEAYPMVVLYGRTNVGKSTLYNCLMEKRLALVSDIAGTTRDANDGLMEWRGLTMHLVDMAGAMEEKMMRANFKKDVFDVEKQVQDKAKKYLKEAKVIILVCDARDGLLPEDKEIAKGLQKKYRDRVILVTNKADNPRIRRETHEFQKLGLGEPVPVSAASGSGTGDLLDLIYERLKDEKKEMPAPTEKTPLRITVIGKPNVGKSSLINKLCGENRQIVSHLPHTTREPKDIEINWKDREILFIDTAGMHKRGLKSVKRTREKESLERLSIGKSLSTLHDADIALLVIDISEEITQQEAKIAEAITNNKCGLIIVANKWDKVAERNTKAYTELIYSHFPYATWAPIQFISAKSGEKVEKLLDLALEIETQRHIELNDNILSKFIKQVISHHRPVKNKGTKKPYVHKFFQTKVCPPKFTLKIGARDTVHDSYVRFVENQLRRKFGFKGTPITIYVEKNRLIHGQHEQFLKKRNEDQSSLNSDKKA
jgi:GTP-binding protein